MEGFIGIIIIAALFFYYDRKNRSRGSHNKQPWKPWSNYSRKSRSRNYPEYDSEYDDYENDEDEDDEEFALPNELMNRLDGPALYVDHSSSDGREKPKAFYSSINKLGARPDYIFRLVDGKIALVELKTGKESAAAIQAAEIQAYAGALAVNQDKYNLPGIRITDIILIFNDHIVKEIRLPADDYEIYRKILPYMEQAWKVSSRQLQLSEHCQDPEKCRACNVSRECQILMNN